MSDLQRRARFEDLHARVHTDLWRYCVRRVWPAEDAEDLMAEVLAVVWRRLEEVPAAPADRPWVFAVARNHIRDRRRQSARRERLLQIAAVEEERAAAAYAALAVDEQVVGDQHAYARAAALRAAMARLSDADAEILRLAVWEELSHREIATRLACREGAVAVRLHRARRRLRRQLEEQVAPSPPPPDSSQQTTGDDRPVHGLRSLDHTSQTGDFR